MSELEFDDHVVKHRPPRNKSRAISTVAGVPSLACRDDVDRESEQVPAVLRARRVRHRIVWRNDGAAARVIDPLQLVASERLVNDRIEAGRGALGERRHDRVRERRR